MSLDSVVCSKLAGLETVEREEEAAFSLESWAQVRSLVNTGTRRDWCVSYMIPWLYQYLVRVNYSPNNHLATLHSFPQHYSVTAIIIPHDNPVIQYHSLASHWISVSLNINPKISRMFSSNHIKGQHLCPQVLIDYVSYPTNHKDSHLNISSSSYDWFSREINWYYSPVCFNYKNRALRVRVIIVESVNINMINNKVSN